jgi:hypothetical protein
VKGLDFMPAQRLGSQPVSIQKYDMAAQDSAAAPYFVRHVGLADEQRDDVRSNSEIRLVHMGPPLMRGQSGNPVHAIGEAGLTAGQIRQIGVFVDEHLSEYEAERVRGHRQYVIHPHVREPDADVPCRRFSCAGFVIEAYRDADLELLVAEPARLPSVDLETLTNAYSDLAHLLRSPARRSRFGLEGEGPWPVVLAGYVMDALNRTVEAIHDGPYTPASGDEYFPARRSSSQESE